MNSNAIQPSRVPSLPLVLPFSSFLFLFLFVPLFPLFFHTFNDTLYRSFPLPSSFFFTSFFLLPSSSLPFPSPFLFTSLFSFILHPFGGLILFILLITTFSLHSPLLPFSSPASLRLSLFPFTAIFFMAFIPSLRFPHLPSFFPLRGSNIPLQSHSFF